MEIIEPENIDYFKIADYLRAGCIIIYPTDTAYALGCVATNEAAVGKIFKIKGRERGKTLPLIVADEAMAREWAEFAPKAEELAREHWPGPLSLVLPVRKEGLAKAVISADNFIALRVPDNEVARNISAELHAPIVSTSANAAGAGPFFNLADVRQSLSDSLDLIDYMIDGGDLPKRSVSTMVKVCNNEIMILRNGAVEIPSSPRRGKGVV